MNNSVDSTVSDGSIITRKDLMKVFWRHFTLLGSLNYERMEGLGFCYSVIPALKKIYGNNDSKLKEALSRHLEAFNITTACSPFVLGITIAMEEQNSRMENFDVSTINAVKAALMGPLSGIGDTFFWGVFRVVAAGIGVSFAAQGSVLGPLIFLLLYNIPNLLVSYYGLFIGYREGSAFLHKMSRSGKTGLITYCASIVGVCVIGAMIASMLDITTPWVVNIGQTHIAFQDIFNQLLPKLLPLLTTLTFYICLCKNVRISKLILIAAILSFACGVFGLL